MFEKLVLQLVKFNKAFTKVIIEKKENELEVWIYKNEMATCFLIKEGEDVINYLEPALCALHEVSFIGDINKEYDYSKDNN